jgi:hypothetical protein
MYHFALGALVLAALAGPVSAGGIWSVGVRFGMPIVARPWSYGYYYRPYPVYVAPPPVIVQPAAIIPEVQVVQPVYRPQVAAPVPAAVASPVSSTRDEPKTDIEQLLQRLSSPDERIRGEAAIQLGRQKITRAVDPLAATLAGDGSPAVREAAARGLGLIGSTKALPALRRAAQVDTDRDVRNSATFAVDVIQTR